MYFSVHRYDNGSFYPGFIVDRVGPLAGSPEYVGLGPGAGFSVNVGWCGSGDYGAPIMGDGDYAYVWKEVLLPMARAFQPSLIIVSAGFDAARGDPLGDCDVTPRGYAYLTQQLMILDCPVVLALEGGYNVPSVKHCMSASIAALCGACEQVDPTITMHRAAATGGLSFQYEDSFRAPQIEARQAVERTITAQCHYWPGVFIRER